MARVMDMLRAFRINFFQGTIERMTAPCDLVPVSINMRFSPEYLSYSFVTLNIFNYGEEYKCQSEQAEVVSLPKNLPEAIGHRGIGLKHN
jgi:hypothetical protein